MGEIYGMHSYVLNSSIIGYKFDLTLGLIGLLAGKIKLVDYFEMN